MTGQDAIIAAAVVAICAIAARTFQALHTPGWAEKLGQLDAAVGENRKLWLEQKWRVDDLRRELHESNRRIKELASARDRLRTRVRELEEANRG